MKKLLIPLKRLALFIVLMVLVVTWPVTTILFGFTKSGNVFDQVFEQMK
jgi:hypothetical protein